MKNILTALLFAIFIFSLAGAAEPEEKSVGDSIKKSQTIRKEVMTEDYQLPRGSAEDKTAEQLQLLIEQLNGLTFGSGDKDQENNDINNADVAKKTVSGSNAVGTEPNKVNKITDKFKADPNQAVDVLLLADVLYRDKKFDKAVVYYKYALKKYKADSSQAWILYQLGNCLKSDYPQQGMEYYNKLLAKFPDSKWSDFAVIEKQICELMAAEELVFAKINKAKALKLAAKNTNQMRD